MSAQKPSKEVLAAMREERIFRFCREHAEQIIAELGTSGGEHGEDVEVLVGLIETWTELELMARDTLDWAEAS